MRECIKCGVAITHHHLYCDKHYPQKTATIKQLKDEVKVLKKELQNNAPSVKMKNRVGSLRNELKKRDQVIIELKQSNKELKEEIDRLKNRYENTTFI